VYREATIITYTYFIFPTNFLTYLDVSCFSPNFKGH